MNINNGFNTIETYCETCSMQYSYSIETYWYHHHWLQDFLLSTISTQTLTIAFLTLCHFITIRRREEGGNTCEEAPYTQKTIQKTDIYIWGKVEQLVITNNNYTQLSWRLMRHVQPGFSSALIYTPIYTFCWMTIVKNSLVLNGNWWFGDPESNPCENTESNSWVFGGSNRWFLGYCLFWFLG